MTEDPNQEVPGPERSARRFERRPQESAGGREGRAECPATAGGAGWRRVAAGWRRVTEEMTVSPGGSVATVVPGRLTYFPMGHWGVRTKNAEA